MNDTYASNKPTVIKRLGTDKDSSFTQSKKTFRAIDRYSSHNLSNERPRLFKGAPLRSDTDKTSEWHKLMLSKLKDEENEEVEEGPKETRYMIFLKT